MSSNEGNTEMKNDLHMACKSNLNLNKQWCVVTGFFCYCFFPPLRNQSASMHVQACMHVSSLSYVSLVGVRDACETEYVVVCSEESITLQVQTSRSISWSTVWDNLTICDVWDRKVSSMINFKVWKHYMQTKHDLFDSYVNATSALIYQKQNKKWICFSKTALNNFICDKWKETEIRKPGIVTRIEHMLDSMDVTCMISKQGLVRNA